MSNQNRQPTGSPASTGGRYATSGRSEPATELAAPSAPPAEPVTAVEIAWAENLTGTIHADSADGYYPTMERIFAQARAVAPAPVTPQYPSEEYRHVAEIADDAGFHPSEGVMPAVLNQILDRGEPDNTAAVALLTVDDLDALYDSHVGPAVDQLSDEIRALTYERGATAIHRDVTGALGQLDRSVTSSVALLTGSTPADVATLGGVDETR